MPGPIKGIKESKDAHRYSCVSEVEDVPMKKVPEMDVDEVDYITGEAKAVCQVTHSAAENQASRDNSQSSNQGKITEKQENDSD